MGLGEEGRHRWGREVGTGLSLARFHLGIQNSNRGDPSLRVEPLVERVTSYFIVAEEGTAIL